MVVYYADFLSRKQLELVDPMTDALGLDNITELRWELGTGWDCLSAEGVEFKYWKNGKNAYTGREKPVLVKVDLLAVDANVKELRVEIGEQYGKPIVKKVPNNPKYIANLIKTIWSVVNNEYNE